MYNYIYVQKEVACILVIGIALMAFQLGSKYREIDLLEERISALETDAEYALEFGLAVEDRIIALETSAEEALEFDRNVEDLIDELESDTQDALDYNDRLRDITRHLYHDIHASLDALDQRTSELEQKTETVHVTVIE